MMQQYFRFKSDPQFRQSLLLFQMGQFLEAFFEDAATLSQVVGVALTARGYHNGSPIPMAGVPLHAQDTYIAKLVKAGVRVVICEQLDGVSRPQPAPQASSGGVLPAAVRGGSGADIAPQDAAKASAAGEPGAASPPSSSSLMRRAVTRVVTRGTVVDESLLTASAHNYIAALALVPSPSNSSLLEAGLAWADISTGHIFTHTVPLHELASTLASYPPAELLVPVVEGPEDMPPLTSVAAASCLPLELALGRRAPASSAPAPAGQSDAATDRLLQHLGQLRLQTGGGGRGSELPASEAPGLSGSGGAGAARALVPRLDLPGSEGGDGCAVSFVPTSTFAPKDAPTSPSTFCASEQLALNGLVSYIRWTQQGALPSLRQPFSLKEEDGGGSEAAGAVEGGGGTSLPVAAAEGAAARSPSPGVHYHFRCLHIDHATRRALEVTRPMNGRRRARGSLLHALDSCETALGSRLLDMRLCTPLADAGAINHRLDAVDWLLHRHALLESVQAGLRGFPDMERCLQRIALGRGVARDLFAIRDGLHAALRVAALLVTGDHVAWHPLGEAGKAVGARAGDDAAAGCVPASMPPLSPALAGLYNLPASGDDVGSAAAGLLSRLTHAGLYDFDVAQPVAGDRRSEVDPNAPPPILLQCAAALLLHTGWGASPAPFAPLSALYARLCDVLIDVQPRGTPAGTGGGEEGEAGEGPEEDAPPAPAARAGPSPASSAWIVRPGFSPELDAARALTGTATEELQRMQELLRQVTGIPSLRLRHTDEMGHTAEVPARHVPVMEAFMRERRAQAAAGGSGGSWVATRAIGPAGPAQPSPAAAEAPLLPSPGSGRDPFAFALAKSLKAGSRYKCPALVKLDASLHEAAARAAALQDAILRQLTAEIAAAAEPLATVCRGAAVVDVTAALAEAAWRYGLVRPHVLPATRGSPASTPVFDVRGGRHLVVERALLEGWSWAAAEGSASGGAAMQASAEAGEGNLGDSAGAEASLAARLEAMAALRAGRGGAEQGSGGEAPTDSAASIRAPVPSTLVGQSQLTKSEWAGGVAAGSLTAAPVPRSFVPNDVVLGGGSAGDAAAPHPTCLVLSGPNMGGKSTYLRQAAHCVILAQTGSFVPAASARLSVVDRLFSRVGASDDVTRDRSTFLVEMEETAAILRGATRDSFVVVDEVGRGTSAVDGLALAWAVLEHLASVTRCRTLFATHMHELAALAVSAAGAAGDERQRLPAMKCAAVAVAPRPDGSLILSHRIGEHPLQARLQQALRGPPASPSSSSSSAAGADADVWRELVSMSYGVNVAAMAGLPAPVLNRAKSVLARLDQSRAAAAWVEAVLAVAAAPPPAAAAEDGR